MEQIPEERGVHNPKVVDLISFDADLRAVVLTMIEARPWGASPDQIKQVEDKFNSYLSYVAAGHLEREYPQYAGAPVIFRLDCAQAPGAMERAFLESVTQFAAGEKIRFVVRIPEDG
ncbi:MAG: DUF6572 domain-containing protein [Myxococcota bacterium]